MCPNSSCRQAGTKMRNTKPAGRQAGTKRRNAKYETCLPAGTKDEKAKDEKAKYAEACFYQEDYIIYFYMLNSFRPTDFNRAASVVEYFSIVNRAIR
jgi:hypothetical protein